MVRIGRHTAILGILLTATPLFAQSGRAELFGTVRDASNLPVSDVTVEARDQSTGAVSRSTTSGAGEFHFFALPPGNYALAAWKPGFSTLRRSGIELRVADRISFDLQLQVGEISQSVDVQAAAPLLQTTSGTESFVVDAEKVVTLPLDGRNFVPLI